LFYFCDEWSPQIQVITISNPVLIQKRNQLEIMLTFAETSINYEKPSENKIEEENKSKKSFGVNFNTLLKVVLIPCRDEYRKAQCDLWWNGNDFFSFKQAARSEIKLLAVYENICMLEARRKLYQPGHSTTLEDNEDTYYNNESDSESQLSPKLKISKKQSLHTVSSIAALPHFQDLLSVGLPLFDECIEDENEFCLSLCVPLEEPGILSTKERPSRRTKIVLSQTFLTFMSIMSIAFPLFLYYYVYFHQ
jgi:hypothetical protein